MHQRLCIEHYFDGVVAATVAPDGVDKDTTTCCPLIPWLHR